MADEKYGSSAGTLIFFSFLLGAAVGSAFALLYAPKTGRELRHDLSDVTGETVDKIKGFGTGVQDKMKTSFNKGKEMLKEKTAGFYSEGKEATFH